ncbi:hypothetical protein HDU96_007347, partial [Phlyctochytrium bullatum]
MPSPHHSTLAADMAKKKRAGSTKRPQKKSKTDAQDVPMAAVVVPAETNGLVEPAHAAHATLAEAVPAPSPQIIVPLLNHALRHFHENDDNEDEGEESGSEASDSDSEDEPTHNPASQTTATTGGPAQLRHAKPNF